MTDKELKKLSRLELLELLLEASRENERLNEQIERLKLENKTTQNIENLSAITNQVESALKYANSLTDSLKSASEENARPFCAESREEDEDSVSTDTENEKQTDAEIYIRMLNFFAKNDSKLDVFPQDIENAVRMRIKSILERKKSK